MDSELDLKYELERLKRNFNTKLEQKTSSHTAMREHSYGNSDDSAPNGENMTFTFRKWLQTLIKK